MQAGIVIVYVQVDGFFFCFIMRSLYLFFFFAYLFSFHTGHPKRGTLANSADPDQMPHDVASDQGLHCLLTGFFIKNKIKATK